MKNIRKSTVLLILAGFALLGIWGATFPKQPAGQSLLPTEPLGIVNAKGEVRRFTVELATTPGEQEKGLMYRTRLPATAGMLFIFAKPQIVDFWMKNTILPLDMVFIRKNGVVDSIARNAPPYSLANIFSAGPVIATLEVPAGTTLRQNVLPGDKVIASQFGSN